MAVIEQDKDIRISVSLQHNSNSSPQHLEMDTQNEHTINCRVELTSIKLQTTIFFQFGVQVPVELTKKISPQKNKLSSSLLEDPIIHPWRIKKIWSQHFQLQSTSLIPCQFSMPTSLKPSCPSSRSEKTTS
jgi:hypothetical protein